MILTLNTTEVNFYGNQSLYLNNNVDIELKLKYRNILELTLKKKSDDEELQKMIPIIL